MNELVLTPASLLDLLSQIDELKDLDVGISETIDGGIQLQIGESIYLIENTAEDVIVDDEVVEDVSSINENTYDELMSGEDFIKDDTIESGVIKELAKTLLVGGLVRLTTKFLKK